MRYILLAIAGFFLTLHLLRRDTTEQSKMAKTPWVLHTSTAMPGNKTNPRRSPLRRVIKSSATVLTTARGIIYNNRVKLDKATEWPDQCWA